MKKLNKLWGILLTLLLAGAAGWYGIDQSDHQKDASIAKSTYPTSKQADDHNGLPTGEDLAPTGKNPGPENLGTASFTSKELADQQKGWITYHELDSLGRPTGADALLKKEMINTGTSANRAIRPPGFVSGPKYDHSRGHLIAKQFGGSGDEPRNLVTLYQFPVNDPYMNYYELEIRHALNKGETVRYRVIPEYAGDQLIPADVLLEAKSLSDPSSINFNVKIPNIK
ncbi:MULTISPECIES: DNA/RNA non-specific endonuclease [unclassified Enterococcus]|uniref:DNA/RNA non-specific endonuclease n=1 Tax=unclassified Enterococcus TaxID=2608891 RepID=UPI0013ED4417|nr:MULTISPECIES: DNA/RNA non-specific endonuclease [unclassified Enterococcus]